MLATITRANLRNSELHSMYARSTRTQTTNAWEDSEDQPTEAQVRPQALSHTHTHRHAHTHTHTHREDSEKPHLDAGRLAANTNPRPKNQTLDKQGLATSTRTHNGKTQNITIERPGCWPRTPEHQPKAPKNKF